MMPAEILLIRKQLQLTQQELGDAIGRTRIQIGAYEGGKSPVPPSVEDKVRSLVKVDPSFDISQPFERQSKEYIGWIMSVHDFAHSISQANREEILKFVREKYLVEHNQRMKK